MPEWFEEVVEKAEEAWNQATQTVNAAHVKEAEHIALQNYNEARAYIPMLPVAESIPGLMPFAENGLGAAAFDGDGMLGFLC